ncbi:dipeptidase [Paenibacillus sp. L3-i20]|uniref:dipeptidase n=1 Tax=Paenibacillus sp. L3-i20 TaxID=2905833 RepID=UPI001EDCBF0C|nr:dipeptidase [Paenibacillus sp. L3-i20]GKU78705.1 diguanylate cyclase [Paenibacillus sp. L3-i20]
MKVIDFHCDVLCKLLLDEKLNFKNDESGSLDVTYKRLQDAGTLLQTFAIYIPKKLNGNMTPILDSIDLFYEKVLTCPNIHLVLTSDDLEYCIEEGKIGALLSLEGVDGLQGNLAMLRNLHRLGVRAAGLTWNQANWAADGVMEQRGGGLTAKGVELIKECNDLGIMLDMSHLSERGFWDVVKLSDKPVFASHSNARAICNHPRNLNDQQIKTIIEANGIIGITYVPTFLNSSGKATIDDIIRHIDYIGSIGGENHIMLGSDFDGIDVYVERLAHPGQVIALKNALLKRYSANQTEGFLSKNALRFLRGQLSTS